MSMEGAGGVGTQVEIGGGRLADNKENYFFKVPQ